MDRTWTPRNALMAENMMVQPGTEDHKMRGKSCLKTEKERLWTQRQIFCQMTCTEWKEEKGGEDRK
jgi:hypothetical protein